MRSEIAQITPASSAAASDEGRVLARTKSICPRCRTLLDAELAVRAGRVVLRRSCPDHGEFAAVVYGDAASEWCPFGFDEAIGAVRLARRAIDDGALGYAVLAATAH